MTGHRFKELRKEWGYSAREIAEQFGRSTSFVYKLERYGDREIPKRWAKALCEFLGIDWEENMRAEEFLRELRESLEDEELDEEDWKNYRPSKEFVEILERHIEDVGEWYM